MVCLGCSDSIFNSHQPSVLCLFGLDHIVDLWLDHSAKWGIEHSLGKVCDMLWYTLAKEKCCEVVRKVVAVVGPKIVSLLLCQLSY